MAMVSMVAMMAACNNGGKDDDDDDNPIEAKAKKFAKEMCKCGDDYDCKEDVEEKIEKYVEDLEKKEEKEFDKAYEKALKKCKEDGDYSYEKRDYDNYDNPYTDGARIGEQACNCMSEYDQESCMKRVEEEYYRLREKYSGSQLDDFESALGLAMQNCSMVEPAAEPAPVEEAVSEDNDYYY